MNEEHADQGGQMEEQAVTPAQTEPAAAPAPAASAPVQDRATAAGYPPDSGPEQEVLLVHPSMLRAKPLVFIGLIILTLAGIAGSLAFGLFGSKPTWLLWPSLLGLVAGLVTLLIWWIQTRGESLRITNKRCVQRQGLFSKRTSEVLHDNVRNIEIYQSFWQRIWRVGRIAISSAGQDGFEIDITEMPNPNQMREIVDLYRPLDR